LLEQKNAEPVEEKKDEPLAPGLLVPPRKSKAVMQNDVTIPHLSQLHEDPMLTGKVYYSLQQGSISFGKRKGKPIP